MSWDSGQPPASSPWAFDARFARGGDSLRPIVGTAGSVAADRFNSTALQVLSTGDPTGVFNSGPLWFGNFTIVGDLSATSNVITNVSTFIGTGSDAPVPFTVGSYITLAGPFTAGQATAPTTLTITGIDPIAKTITMSAVAGFNATFQTILITDPTISTAAYGPCPNGTWSWNVNLFADWRWPVGYVFGGGALNSGTGVVQIQLIDGSGTVLTTASCSGNFTVDNTSALTSFMSYSIGTPSFGPELLTSFNGVKFNITNSNVNLNWLDEESFAGSFGYHTTARLVA